MSRWWLVSVVVGCASLDEADTEVAWGALQDVFREGTTSVVSGAELAALGSAPVVFEPQPCSGGGQIDRDGTLSIGREPGVERVLESTARYAACIEADVQIDGELDAVVTAFTVEPDGVEDHLMLTGRLTFTGAVDGTCDVVLDRIVPPGVASLGVPFAGTVCGHDVGSFED